MADSSKKNGIMALGGGGATTAVLLMPCQPIKVVLDFNNDDNDNKLNYGEDVAVRRRSQEGGGRNRAKEGGRGVRCPTC